MITATRRLSVDTGHRLQKHESKCRNYHGHRYDIDITVSASELDSVGRVIDFGAIKELVGGWLDECIDHGMVLEEGDPMIPLLLSSGTKVLVVPFAPTAENLAAMVATQAQALLSPKGITVRTVRVWETPNCYADWSL